MGAGRTAPPRARCTRFLNSNSLLHFCLGPYPPPQHCSARSPTPHPELNSHSAPPGKLPRVPSGQPPRAASLNISLFCSQLRPRPAEPGARGRHGVSSAEEPVIRAAAPPPPGGPGAGPGHHPLSHQLPAPSAAALWIGLTTRASLTQSDINTRSRTHWRAAGRLSHHCPVFPAPASDRRFLRREPSAL